MNKLKNILVGVDFSECSRRALEQAVRLAQWNQARLRIIHALDPDALDLGGGEMPPALDELRGWHRAQSIARLAEWAEQAGAPSGHSREVMYGAPLAVLLQESRSRDADLLVLGATGESAPTHGAGTLATKCLRKAAIKVLLVHARQTRPFRRVLACVDFSETSRVAVTQAMHVAAQDQAELYLLHVFRGEWKLWDSQIQSPALADFEKSHRAILENNLRLFTAVPSGVKVISAVTQANTHGAGIAEYAHQIKADLVVLGSKGRTNLKYVLLGSTVDRLLKEIPCSALVVRSATAAGG